MNPVSDPGELIARNPKASVDLIEEALAILKATGCAGPTEYRLGLPYSRPVIRSEVAPEDDPRHRTLTPR